jgi:hypothetical protein
MSDFFSGLFGGGGGGDGGGGAPAGGGGGGGDFFSNLFGGGGGGGGLGGLFGGTGDGGLGMGAFDPSQMFQQTPQQAAAQGGDPSGQLAGSQPGQGQGQGGQDGGQGGQGKGQGTSPDFLKLIGDALSGRMQKPGYNPMGGMASGQPSGGGLPGLASQAAQSGQMPSGGRDDAGALAPGQAQPSGGRDDAGALAPGQAQQPGAPGATGIPSGPAGSSTVEAPIPPSRPASLGGGGAPGATTPTAPGATTGPYADEGQRGMAAATGGGGGTVPAKLGPGGQQPGGQQPGGGQGGQQGFGQFMQSPLGQIVQALIGQMLGRIGPGGQALASILSPMLSQLAGQAGMGGEGGQGGSQWNPEYPPVLRGREMWNRAMPGGAAGRTGNAFTDSVVGAESNGQNIVSHTDRDSRGLTVAQGGNPNEVSQGYFQIQNHPGGTWQTYARRAGVDLNQYPSPRSAPFEVQHKVAQSIPVSAWGPRTQQILRQKFGSFDGHQTLGQVEARYGGGQGGQPTAPPNPYRNLGRRRRQNMAMGWQF